MRPALVLTGRPDDQPFSFTTHRRDQWAGLDDLSGSLLAARSVRKEYAAGEELIAQGASCNRVGIISRGLVKVVMITEDGNEHILQIQKPGQMVGEIVQAATSFTWDAATPVEVLWLNRATLFDLMRERPLVARAVLGLAAQQLDDLRFWAADMRGRNTLERIAFWLLMQAHGRASGQGRQLIQVALSRRDLASYLDMTSETLCRGLNQLSVRGAIRLRTADLIEIRDIARLRTQARCAPGDGAARPAVLRRGLSR